MSKAGYFKPKLVDCPNSADGACCHKKTCRMFYCRQCGQSYPACYGGAPDPRCDNCVAKEVPE